jgi:hypothetical protein
MPEIFYSDEEIDAITNNLFRSDYRIIATGFRDCSFDEVKGMLGVLLNGGDIVTFYKTHPKTIGINKNFAKNQCLDSFDEDNCDCYLGGQEPFWCERKRAERINGKSRNYPEYKEWRTKVFERDNFTCVMCGKVGGQLEAHHIKPYVDHLELRVDLDNGITLCKDPCHKNAHQKGS